jgi:hypothetical protein
MITIIDFRPLQMNLNGTFESLMDIIKNAAAKT